MPQRTLQPIVATTTAEFAEQLEQRLIALLAAELALSEDEIAPHVSVEVEGRPDGQRLRVHYSEERLPLKAFDPVQTPAGVEYEIEAGDADLIPGAFVSEAMGGHVFVREDNDSPADTGHLPDEQMLDLPPDFPDYGKLIKLDGPSIAAVARASRQIPGPAEIAQMYADALGQRVGGDVEAA